MRVLSDRGKVFLSKTVRQFMKSLGLTASRRRHTDHNQMASSKDSMGR